SRERPRFLPWKRSLSRSPAKNWRTPTKTRMPTMVRPAPCSHRPKQTRTAVKIPGRRNGFHRTIQDYRRREIGQIRELREDEREGAVYVSSQAFRHGERDTSSTPDPNRLPSVTFGVWDEAGLQAKVVVIAYQMHFGPDVVISMGGVAGVACLPAA